MSGRAAPHLVAALAWRAWRGQRLRLLLVPLLLAAVVLALSLVALYVPGVLTGASQQALGRAAGSFTGLGSGQRLAMVMLTVQAPHVVAVLSASVASSVAVSAFGAESSRGGFESLLAGPYTDRDVVYGLGGVSVVLSLVSWLVLAAGTACAAAVTLLVAGVPGHVVFDHAGRFGDGLLLPLPFTLWGALAGVVVVMLFPRVAQVRIGNNANVTQLVAMVPGLVVVFLGASRLDLPVSRITAGGLAADAVLAVLLLPVIAGHLRRDVLLET